MSNTVHVSGISAQTSEKEVREFFSFCGKVTSLSVTPVSGEENAEKSATVTFEKETAAKTALLLDNTQLGSSPVHVSAAHTIEEMAERAPSSSPPPREGGNGGHPELAQEDKPRSRIVAEYLAQGYTLTDTAIQHAITLDQKHGFSSKFQSALANFDSRYHATDKARGLDTKMGISDKAEKGWKGLSTYFEKAMGTPTGRKVRDFYLQSDKQIKDIHNEAKRLAELQSGKAAEGAEGAEGAAAAQEGEKKGEQSASYAAAAAPDAPADVPRKA
ncbi:hypothetical protein AJ80_04363 [Polytolypa hystricis UAMH7299]|uniref:RRM domain-containing protein n=1 Tax=Polytolypa hystricis (strain UAMH7299) TaxID=1447883 RepID=A0A2B7YBX9_POLH7|nr:hypothetical protein AJ80_04363 [Polytolypa hystricis UAMH7299]